MVTDPPNEANALVPLRHSQGDLFICDIVDATIKDIVPWMEHPFFSLSKNPDREVRHYEHNGNTIDISPNVKGMPTIWDKDILIYCTSQLMERKNRGEPLTPYLRINSYDLLVFTNRGTGGKDYQAICDAVDRLAGVRIMTNIKTGGEVEHDVFGLVERGHVSRKEGKNGKKGRAVSIDIKMSDWVMKAIQTQEVLTMHRSYFRLGSPLDRRIYELARKHCGRQEQWVISIETLRKKSGSKSPEKRFREMMKEIAQSNHLPDYLFTYDEETDNVTLRPREAWWEKNLKAPDPDVLPPLPTTAYEKAKATAPGYDVYALEQEWRDWSVGKKKPRDVVAAFVGFCAARHRKAPLR